MPKITIVFGLLLCGLSAVVLVLKGEFVFGTWLIPTAVGLPLMVLGALAGKSESGRKHYMHASVTLGLIGALLGLIRGIPQLIQWIGGSEVNLLAATMVWAMAVICSIYVFLCVQSFVQARKAREKSQGS
jgi:hypothetical protein